MNRRILFAGLVSIFMLVLLGLAQMAAHGEEQKYKWLYVGAWGNPNETTINYGAKTVLRTETPQFVKYKTYVAYWVGAWLGSFNNDFVQVGYAISYENPNRAFWFWQHWVCWPCRPVDGFDQLEGDMGPDGSVHTYEMRAPIPGARIWNIYVDGVQKGTVNAYYSFARNSELHLSAELSCEDAPCSKNDGNDMGPVEAVQALLWWNRTWSADGRLEWNNVKSGLAFYATQNPDTWGEIGELCPPYGVEGKLQNISFTNNNVIIGENVGCTPHNTPLWNITFEEGFEYADSPLNHGWQNYSTTSRSLFETQTDVRAEGDRALKIMDSSPIGRVTLYRPIPSLTSPQIYDVEYYLRANQENMPVRFRMTKDNVDTDVIRTELSDDARGRILINGIYYQEYQRWKWYHFRLMVNMSSQTFDAYIDGALVDTDIPFLTSTSYINGLKIGTSTLRYGTGYWDGIITSIAYPAYRFYEGFEYMDSPLNHGWTNNSTTTDMTIQTQPAIVAERERALRIIDNNATGRVSIYKNIAALESPKVYRAQYFLRANQTDMVVGLSYSSRGETYWIILTELSDNGNIRFQNLAFWPYEPDKWYNITLIIRMSQRTFDAYVNGTLKVQNESFWGSDEKINIIHILTATAGRGRGYWDGVKITEEQT